MPFLRPRYPTLRSVLLAAGEHGERAQVRGPARLVLAAEMNPCGREAAQTL